MCWGADQRVLKKLYGGRIGAVLEYGMTSRCTAAKSNTVKSNRIPNQKKKMDTKHGHHIDRRYIRVSYTPTLHQITPTPNMGAIQTDTKHGYYTNQH